MLTYIIRRLIYAIVVLFLILTFVFFLIHAIPGDPAAATLRGFVDREASERIREHLGLNRPIIVQYAIYLKNIFKRDLGNSYFYDIPVTKLVKERVPATLELAFLSISISFLLSVMLGTLAASRVNLAWDRISATLSLLGQSLPSFWVGIMLVLVFSRFLKLLPTSGRGGIAHLIMPLVTTSLPLLGVTTRLVRSSLIETLYEDYIRTAYAKGLKQKVVLIRHALRNSLLSVITFVSLQLGHLLGGVVVIETVFAWPGLGKLTIDSILRRDYPVIVFSVIMLSGIFMLINLVVDIIYVYLDPRIKLM